MPNGNGDTQKTRHPATSTHGCNFYSPANRCMQICRSFTRKSPSATKKSMRALTRF
jgi:hypothetical protein